MSEMATSSFLVEVSLDEKPVLKIKILHVDDDPCNLEVSKSILELENNFEVDNALSVDEALQKLEKQTYDAIVSDYEMPMKNGLEFLRELREQHRETPFILFTGKGREDVAVKALNLGADRYLNKNGSPEAVYCELADAINKTVERKKSKQLLVESEINYRTVVEKSLQGILITQTSPLRLVFANESMGKILGYSTEELKSLSPLGVAGLIYDEDKAVFFSRLESRMRGEPAPSSLEFRAVRKDGSIVWLEAFASRIEYMGQPAVQGMFLDIDERKKAQEIVRKSEERYRELANFLPEIVFEADLTGKITFFSQRAFEITGFAPEELEKGMNMLSFVIPEERERAKENIKKSIAGKTRKDNEYTLLKKDGATYNAIVRTAPIISENKVTGLRGLVIDITENKKAEEALMQERNKLESIAAASGAGLVVISKDYHVLWANDFIRRYKGDTIGKLCYATLNSLDAPCSDCGVAKIYAGKTTLDSHEYFSTTVDGNPYWVEIVATPLTDEKGNITSAVEICVDITERKKAEENMKMAANIFDLATDSIYVHDTDGNIVNFNEAACKTLGYSKDEMVKMNIRDLDAPGTAVQVKDRLELLLEKGSGVFDSVQVCKDKTLLTAEVHARLVDLGGKKLVLGVARNVTERKKAEEASKKQAALIDLSPDAVIVKKLDETITFWNAGAERLYGYTKEEALGQKINILLKAKNSKSFNGVITQLKQGKNWTGEITNYAKNNNEVIVQSHWTATVDAQGGIVEILESNIDITQRKKAEEASQESQQKFKALFSANPDAAVFLDTDFHVVEANSRFSTLFGYSLDEIKGKIVTDLIVPDDSKEESRIVRQKIISGSVEIVTARKRKDGSQIPLFMSGGPVFVNGKVIGSIMVYKDISDIITVQEELSKALAKAELLNEKLRVVGSLSRHDVRNKLSAVTCLFPNVFPLFYRNFSNCHHSKIPFASHIQHSGGIFLINA